MGLHARILSSKQVVGDAVGHLSAGTCFDTFATSSWDPARQSRVWHSSVDETSWYPGTGLAYEHSEIYRNVPKHPPGRTWRLVPLRLRPTVTTGAVRVHSSQSNYPYWVLRYSRVARST